MNNLIETDHASMPLGILASKSVSLSDWQIQPTSKNFASRLVSNKTNIGGVGTPPYVVKSTPDVGIAMPTYFF